MFRPRYPPPAVLAPAPPGRRPPAAAQVQMGLGPSASGLTLASGEDPVDDRRRGALRSRRR